MATDRIALLSRLEQAATSGEPDVLREALRWAIEELMEADVTERLGAAPYERTPERLGQRNGHRVRELDSRLGSLELAVPQLHSACGDVPPAEFEEAYHRQLEEAHAA